MIELESKCWVCDSYTACPECAEMLEQQKQLQEDFERGGDAEEVQMLLL